MTITVQALEELAKTMRVDRLGPAEVQPGDPVPVQILPPPSELRITEILTIAGFTVPLPVEVPVSVEVQWHIFDSDGITELGSADFVQLDGQLVPNPAGLDTASAAFLFAPANVVELTSRKELPEPTRRIIRAKVRLSAKPTPIPPGVTTTEVTVPSTPDFYPLPDLSVLVTPLAVPTVVALFRHRNFAPYELSAASWEVGPVTIRKDGVGACLVMVAGDSLVKEVGGLLAVLRKLEPVLERLSYFGYFALLLLGLRSLTFAVTAQPNIAFRSTDGIFDFNRIKFVRLKEPFVLAGIPVPGTDVADDVEAEDEVSSMILIGPPPRVIISGKGGRTITKARCVECFNRRDYLPTGGKKGDKGQMVVRVENEMCAILHDLHSDPPKSIPPNRVAVPVKPFDHRVWWKEGFGDILSSVRFGWTTVKKLPVRSPRGARQLGFARKRRVTRR